MVLAGNMLLRPLVAWVNRRPFEAGTEARYRVLVTCARPDLAAVRDLLDAELEAAYYPVQHTEIASAGETEVEVAAILLALEADPAELDALTDKLAHAPEIETATWSASVTGLVMRYEPSQRLLRLALVLAGFRFLAGAVQASRSPNA